MNADHEIDFIRFYAYLKFPCLKPVSDGFSQMIFNHSHFWEGYRKFYVYSDHPHLRRSTFLEKNSVDMMRELNQTEQNIIK